MRKQMLLLASCALAALASSILWTGDLHACLHAGRRAADPPVPVTQRGQQAIIVHHDGRQELILQVDFQAEVAPPSLGWIIPLPSVPDRYETASTDLFEEIEAAAQLQWANVQCRSRGVGEQGVLSAPTPLDGLTLLEPASVGPYQIQPIQATGDAGVAALGTWMEDNGFMPITAEGLSYYTEREWTFLAIKVAPPEEQTMDSVGALPPLHISFPSEHLVYPLKLSTHMGIFPVTVYVLTPSAPDREAFRGARERGFYVAGANQRCDDLSARLACGCNHPFLEAAHQVRTENRPGLTALMATIGLSADAFPLTVLHTPSFGDGDAAPMSWPEDLILDLTP